MAGAEEAVHVLDGAGMPGYRESLTVAKLIDLGAYCKSLTDMRDHGPSVKPSSRGQQHKRH